MNVVVGSAFRNSTRLHVQRYMRQVAQLRNALPHARVRVRAVEGDSANETRHLLASEAAAFRVDLDLATCNHGGPVWGSTEQPERMAALSLVANAIFDGVRDDDDVLVYVESDLIWDAGAIVALIEQLGPDRDVVAPLVMAGQHFYDIWAFRVGGARFSPFKPFYAGLVPDGLTPVDSAGSCLVMRADVARAVRMRSGALVEWCDNARAAGYRIYCDARRVVNHP